MSQPELSSRTGLYVVVLRECDSSTMIAGPCYVPFFLALLGKGSFKEIKDFCVIAPSEGGPSASQTSASFSLDCWKLP